MSRKRVALASYSASCNLHWLGRSCFRLLIPHSSDQVLLSLFIVEIVSGVHPWVAANLLNSHAVIAIEGEEIYDQIFEV